MADGVPARRPGPRPVRLAAAARLVLVAALLSAGKVLLYTTGTTLFLSRDGIAALPYLYVTLAAVATAVSIGLAAVVDRLPGGQLLPAVALAAAVVTGGLMLALMLDLPQAAAAVLVVAHLYDIVTDIVFWVLAAAFFDNLRLRRLTTRFYIAIALGGSAAGLLAERALAFVPPEQLLWPVVALAALAVLALGRLPVPAITEATDEAVAGGGAFADVWHFLRRHPFAFLLALNSMMLTVVYSLTEFVCFALYAESYPDEAALGRFLALLFAGLQLAELGVLWLAARGVVERSRPLLRNLLFPVASLGCLVALLFQPRLAWGVVAHVNTEAVSNGIFEPVNATNYGALPATVHGRARTLADGVFYPLGMAMAGLLLALLPADDAAFRATVLATVAAGFFVALNLVVAQHYLPTLVRQLRHGLRLRPAMAGGRGPVLHPARLGPLLAGRRAGERALALDLAEAGIAVQGLADPAPLLEPLLAAGRRAADADWARIAALVARLDPELLEQRLVAASASGDGADQALLAAARLLAGGRIEGPAAAGLDPMVATFQALLEPASDGSGQGVERKMAGGLDAVTRDRLAGLLRQVPPGLAPLLARRLDGQEAAEPLRQALLEAVVRHPPAVLEPALVAMAKAALDHPAAARRATALGALAGMLAPPERLELALGALADPSRQVRQVAVANLLPLADQALLRLARASENGSPLPAGALELLAAIGDRPSRRLLRRVIDGLARTAERDAILIDRVVTQGGPAFVAAEAALLDHAREVTDRLFIGLAALGEAAHAKQLRRALGEADLRLVAGGIDGLVSLRHGRLARRFVPLLEQLHLPRSAAPRRSGELAPADLLAGVEAVEGRWLAAAASLIRRSRQATAGQSRNEADMPIFSFRERAADDGSKLEAMLRLKRFELLAGLPLDALESLLGQVEERRLAAGMTAQRPGDALLHLWLVDEGSVEVVWPDGRMESVGPGGIVGEAALADSTVTAPEITAATVCRLLQLHRVAFDDLARDQPVLLEALCRLLARRLREERAGQRRVSTTRDGGSGATAKASAARA